MKWAAISGVLVIFYVCMYSVLYGVGEQNKENVKKLEQVSNEVKKELPPKKQVYVLYFYADWCAPCNLMKPHWRHPTVVDQLKKYKNTKYRNTYVPIKINIDEQLNVAKFHKVTTIPHIILMTIDGKHYGRIGYSSQTKLRDFLTKGPQWPKAKQ